MDQYWEPNRIWNGADVYVVGGGPSLRGFDWDLLRNRGPQQKTIGCNSAFMLGTGILDAVVFGDVSWWERIGKDRLPAFGGLVVCATPRLHNDQTPWLLKMRRKGTANGLGVKTLGWNGNTGSLAINLALLLGAKNVYLLGFDMKLGDNGKRANWHDLRYEGPKASVYPRFMHEMRSIVRDLPKLFPGCSIVNVSDVSEMDLFPKISIAEHFQENEVNHGTRTDRPRGDEMAPSVHSVSGALCGSNGHSDQGVSGRPQATLHRHPGRGRSVKLQSRKAVHLQKGEG